MPKLVLESLLQPEIEPRSVGRFSGWQTSICSELLQVSLVNRQQIVFIDRFVKIDVTEV